VAVAEHTPAEFYNTFYNDELFDNVLINSGHVLYSILPRETVSTYALRRRRHIENLLAKLRI